MRAFMDDNFLLDTPTAQELFHSVAEDLPIYDYHCHLSPKEIWEDKHFKNITEVWLYGDHYKWRFMRSLGVDERYITGDASDYDKFLTYAGAVQYAIGNPLYHWSHLELRRYFGIDDILNEANAPAIWEKANAVIAGDDFSARGLIRRSNVAFIGTTDDPADSLEYHRKLAEDATFATQVRPTFRPDNAIHLEKDGFAAYIDKLSHASGVKSAGLDDILAALDARMAFFHEVGCRISDHAFGYVPYTPASHSEADEIVRKVLGGGRPSAEEADKYKTCVLQHLARGYAQHGWAMQLHIGALRNNNTRMFRVLGPDTGFDSVDDSEIAYKLSRLLDSLDVDGCLPKTVLYTLNPKDNWVLATMTGNFQSAQARGKIQFGSAWWFNDHIDGMREQMRALGNVGALAGFVGMLTDSRSFLSYPRHEYFRRIVCNLLGDWVERGEFPDDRETLAAIVRGICYENAQKYFA